ncbi:hypothetical protein Leryth_009642 [Lithospermum erythrorhizon]|nr:hypothetical protein Leryth_009642 [Lithospermum erythrorhizon]
MLPLCSATATHLQISVKGGLRYINSWSKTLDCRCNIVDRVTIDFSNGTSLKDNPYKSQSVMSWYSSFVENNAQYDSSNMRWSYEDREANHGYEYPSSMGDGIYSQGAGEFRFVDNSDLPAEDNVTNFSDQIVADNNSLLGSTTSQSVVSDNPFLPTKDQVRDLTDKVVDKTNALPEAASVIDSIKSEAAPVSDSLSMDTGSLSNPSSISDAYADVSKAINESVMKGKTALTASIDNVSSSVADALKGAKDVLNKVIGEVTSSVDQSGDLANSKLSGLSGDLKEASGRVGVLAVDALRHTIVIVEDSLIQGAKYFEYAYGSTKEVLPQEIRDVLNFTEEKTTIILKPVWSALQQAYIVLENFEKGLGIDPNDPVVPFLLFLGASAAIWGSYRIVTYGGYSGDLSPESTLNLLKGKQNADLRDRDGIPDLRRRARSRYANVDFLEVDNSIRKLLRSGKDLDDSLVASVIRNLKIVQDRPKVIIMDADGSRSKGVARSLRKLGTKARVVEANLSTNFCWHDESYLVHGGFRSWVKDGLRIKQMGPETTLTILNEEAEAILEEINPSLGQLLAYGAGLAATAFAIVEWETTLQFVGILGLGVTLYRRVASYEDSDDFKEDIQLLLAPVKVGGQAILSAAGRLETSSNGLPTSPSSTDVQNRVLQAAAKHESRPSDEEIQESSSSLPEPTSENIEISEA